MHASTLLTSVASISKVLLSNLFTEQPRLVNILSKQCTSSISGTLSIMHFPSLAIIAAGSMATAEFLAPFISTDPFKTLPPFITNFSIHFTLIIIYIY